MVAVSEAPAEASAGVLRPDEPDPEGASSRGGRLDTASSRARWGHCGWASDGGACLWGGSPRGDPREVLAIGRGGSQRRERLLTTGACPTWREAHACAPIRLALGDDRRARGEADPPVGVAHVVFGGRGEDDAFLNDLHVIDAAFRWRSVAATGSPPAPRAGHCLVAVGDGEAVVFGGRGADGRVFDDVHFLTFRECASSTKVSSVSSHEKRSEKTGGGADESREAVAWTCAWRPSAANRNGANHRGESRFARPRAREGASAAFQPPTASAKRGTVWVFGGCGGEDGETLFDDVWAFDVASETWREAASGVGSRSRPKPRFAHACAVVRVDALVDVVANVDGCSKSKTHDSMMVAHGGVGNDAKTLSDLWTFSFRDETWREVSGEILVGFVPKPRAMFAAVLCGARVLFLGGIQDARGGVPSNLGEASALALRRDGAPRSFFEAPANEAEPLPLPRVVGETKRSTAATPHAVTNAPNGDFDYAGAFRATSNGEATSGAPGDERAAENENVSIVSSRSAPPERSARSPVRYVGQTPKAKAKAKAKAAAARREEEKSRGEERRANETNDDELLSKKETNERETNEARQCAAKAPKTAPGKGTPAISSPTTTTTDERKAVGTRGSKEAEKRFAKAPEPAPAPPSPRALTTPADRLQTVVREVVRELDPEDDARDSRGSPDLIEAPAGSTRAEIVDAPPPNVARVDETAAPLVAEARPPANAARAENDDAEADGSPQGGETPSPDARGDHE